MLLSPRRVHQSLLVRRLLSALLILLFLNAQNSLPLAARPETARSSSPPALQAPPSGGPVGSRRPPQPDIIPHSLPAKATLPDASDDSLLTAPRQPARPLAIVPNAGQADAGARFEAHTLGGTVAFASNEVTFTLPTPQTSSSGEDSLGKTPDSQALLRAWREDLAKREKQTILRLQFLGANTTPRLSVAEPQSGVVNYFTGNERSAWHSKLQSYGALLYTGLYKGIDLHYAGTDGSLKSTYTVASGSDPSQIRWRYDGAQSVTVDPKTGDLQISVPPDRKDTDPRAADSQSPILTEAAPIA